MISNKELEKKRFDQSKQKLDLALAMDRASCEKSLYYFYKQAFAVLEPSTPYKEGWHVEYLCFILQREFERIEKGVPAPFGEIVINVPPRTSKSLIFSVVFPVWAWTRNPSFTIITSSYALDLSTNFSFLSQQLMKSEWFQSRWPEEKTFSIDRRLGGKESVEHTVTNKQGKRKATSTGANVTGFGGLIILQDDPQNPKGADSEAETLGAINFYTGSLINRLNDQNTGVVFTIMQRLSEEDVSAFILDRGQEGNSVLHINLPAIKDGSEKIPSINKLPHLSPYPDGLLFPNLLGQKALDKLRGLMGELGYATQYLQQPFPASGLIAKREHFLRISPEDFDTRFRAVPKVWNFLVDTSYGDKKAKAKSDPSGAMSYWIHDGRVYIRNVSTKVVPSEDLPEWLIDYRNSHGAISESKMKIEPKASGKTVVGLIKKMYKEINVEEYKYKSGGVNINTPKPERLRAILPYLSAGNVILIDGMWTESFILEVIGFPNAKHDECVDLLVMACLDATIGKGGRKKRKLGLHN